MDGFKWNEHLTGNEPETRGPMALLWQPRDSKVGPGSTGDPWSGELWPWPLHLPIVRRQREKKDPYGVWFSECPLTGTFTVVELNKWLMFVGSLPAHSVGYASYNHPPVDFLPYPAKCDTSSDSACTDHIAWVCKVQLREATLFFPCLLHDVHEREPARLSVPLLVALAPKRKGQRSSN